MTRKRTRASLALALALALAFAIGPMLFLAIGAADAVAVDYPIAIQRGDGLANVFARLNSGQRATIAYIGGSVTQMTGWRDNVTAWFNSRYPGRITEINAGWSGTGSLIGAMRLARDVLVYNPDLIFVEFAVNDLPEDPPLFVERNSEGIIRQAWAQNAMTDVCFIETIAWYGEQPYLNGYYPTPVQAHYNICDLYGCPSVNVGWALYERVLAGTPWTDLAPDRVHPNAAGSQIYSGAVIDYLETERTRGALSASHNTPTPLTDFPVTGGTVTDIVTVSPLPSGWSARYNEYGVAGFVQSGTAGSTISTSFTGPEAALKILIAPDSGDIAYSVDGGVFAPGNVPVNGYTFLWALPVSKTASFGPHTLTVRVTSGVARLIDVEAATSTVDGGPGPNETNFALTATASRADSACGPDWDSSKARDGLTGTKWCSTDATQSHWLAYDLGTTVNVLHFVVKHAGSGGEWTSFNTKAFTIESGPDISGPWTTEFVGSNPGQLATSTFAYAMARPLRYVRLSISDPGVDNYARIPEFEVWGTVLPPVIAQHPQPQSVCPGTVAVFTVTATGEGTLTYQWQKNGLNLGNGGHYGGVTTPTLAISGADSGDAASYRCVVSNSGGSTPSNSAALAVKTVAIADLDHDCDVDLSDFSLFQACFNGPNHFPAGGCAADADFDNDADVDLGDFSVFQLCFNGPNHFPTPNCP